MPSRTRSKYNSLPHGSPTAAHRSATELFGVAVRHHLANELDAAERGYRGVIALEPKFAEALNNLGVLLRERDAKAAHDLFERAVAARSRYTEAQFNLALSFMGQAKLVE